MMNKRTLFVLFFTSLVIQSTLSQSFNYEPGYYINKNSDTIRGYFLFSELDRVSKGIEYKSSLESESSVLICSNEIDRAFLANSEINFKNFLDTATKLEYLVQELSNGPISLYKTRIDDELALIVNKNDKSFILKEYKIVDGAKVRDRRYKGILDLLTLDCERPQNQYGNHPYSMLRIKKFVDDYNKCADSSATSTKRSIKAELRINGGFNYNTNEYAFFTRYIDSKSEYHLGLNVGALLMINLASHTKLGIGINYNEHKGSFDDYQKYDGLIPYDAKINFSFLEIPIQVNYYLIDKDFKMSANGAFIAGLLLKNDFKEKSVLKENYTEVDFPLSKLKFGYKTGLGFEYKSFYFQPSFYYGLGRSGINVALVYSGTEYLVGYILNF